MSSENERDGSESDKDELEAEVVGMESQGQLGPYLAQQNLSFIKTTE